MATPTTEPTTIAAGDTVTWRRDLPDYPAGEWTLKYRLINLSGHIDIVTTASGTTHVVDEPASTTVAWTAGTYIWQSYVVDGAGVRYTIGSGTMVIKPNLAAMSAGYDARSTARKALDDARAARAAYIATNGHVAEYEIAGRRMKYKNAAEIEAHIQALEREVASEAKAERLAAGLPSGNRVLVRLR
jgi:hypothetical protein